MPVTGYEKGGSVEDISRLHPLVLSIVFGRHEVGAVASFLDLLFPLLRVKFRFAGWLSVSSGQTSKELADVLPLAQRFAGHLAS